MILPPRDSAWRGVAPDFQGSLGLAASGLPFHIVADRRHDRSGNPRALARAIAQGKTVLLPQIHQVLPRLMRLMVALRAAFLGPSHDACSFLFAVKGRGREAMGLHHDGEVDAFWLQLEGRRTITVGPRVPRGTPPDLGDHHARRGRAPVWGARDLTPGTLFYMPPRTPHRVVCHGRSLALSLTWERRREPNVSGGARPLDRARIEALTEWDVVSGQADAIPRSSRSRLWVQVPVVAGLVNASRNEFPIWMPDSVELWLPARMRPLARRLEMMPSLRWPTGPRERDEIRLLMDHGILGRQDLPLRIAPEDPAALDGWRFA